MELAHSREWDLTVADGDLVDLVCRPRPKAPGAPVHLFLADPADGWATVGPVEDLAQRDMARKQRVVTREGKVLFVWAHKSGYLRSLDPRHQLGRLRLFPSSSSRITSWSCRC